MQNQQVEPVLILYVNYKAVKYISLVTIAQKVRVGCRKNFVNADILVDQELPGEGMLFQLRREQQSQHFSIKFIKGEWSRENLLLKVKTEEQIPIKHGDQFGLVNAPMVLYHGDSSDILSDSVSDDSADLEGNALDKYLLNYQNFTAPKHQTQEWFMMETQDNGITTHSKCGVKRHSRLSKFSTRKWKKME